MKLISTLLILLALACPASAQMRYIDPPADDGSAARAAKERADKASEAAQQQNRQLAALAQRNAALDRGQWRIVDGVTNGVRDPGWFHFYGEVQKVETNGLLVHGVLAPLSDETPVMVQYFFEGYSALTRGLYLPGRRDLPEKIPQFQDFFLVNFPHPVIARDPLEPKMYYMAKYVGVIEHRYSGQLRKYDFGQLSVEPPPHVVAKKNAEKKSSQDAVIKFYQDKAAAGDATSQRRLGLRYIKGDGVEKDLAKGREWLVKAAAQGDTEAADELKKL
jgi:hypothetical protein